MFKISNRNFVPPKLKDVISIWSNTDTSVAAGNTIIDVHTVWDRGHNVLVLSKAP